MGSFPSKQIKRSMCYWEWGWGWGTRALSFLFSAGRTVCSELA